MLGRLILLYSILQRNEGSFLPSHNQIRNQNANRELSSHLAWLLGHQAALQSNSFDHIYQVNIGYLITPIFFPLAVLVYSNVISSIHPSLDHSELWKILGSSLLFQNILYLQSAIVTDLYDKTICSSFNLFIRGYMLGREACINGTISLKYVTISELGFFLISGQFKAFFVFLQNGAVEKEIKV